MIQARLAALRPLAKTCSDRELAILACAVHELAATHKVDAMKETVVIQVETRRP